MEFPLRNKKERGGFTLIEILVVLMITALLSGVVVFYGTNARSRNALIVEGSKVAQLLLRAKSLAISTYNIPPIPCGYGVFFDHFNNRYSLISYLEIAGAADDPRCKTIKDADLDESAITFFENSTFALSPGVIYYGDTYEASYILFVPPEPKTYIYLLDIVNPSNAGKPITSGIGTVSLQTADTGEVYAIDVNTFGQLSFR